MQNGAWQQLEQGLGARRDGGRLSRKRGWEGSGMRYSKEIM